MSDPIRYPRGETVWVRYCSMDGVTRFLLTSRESRECFFLYYVAPDGSLTRLGKAKSPPELERKFNVEQVLRDFPKQN